MPSHDATTTDRPASRPPGPRAGNADASMIAAEARAMTEHITSQPGILGGKPVVAGTRLSVEFLLELIAGGATYDEVLAAYPELSRAGLEAALRYAARAVSNAIGWDVRRTP